MALPYIALPAGTAITSLLTNCRLHQEPVSPYMHDAHRDIGTTPSRCTTSITIQDIEQRFTEQILRLHVVYFDSDSEDDEKAPVTSNTIRTSITMMRIETFHTNYQLRDGSLQILYHKIYP
eukprot:scaffold38532_cov71-Attheya_sp.AAC.3